MRFLCLIESIIYLIIFINTYNVYFCISFGSVIIFLLLYSNDIIYMNTLHLIFFI